MGQIVAQGEQFETHVIADKYRLIVVDGEGGGDAHFSS